MSKKSKKAPGIDKPMNDAQLIMSGALNPSLIDSDKKQSWEDLESIYQSCSEALVVANNSVVELFKIPGVIDNIENRQETKVALLGLNKDIKFFSEELKEIHKEHADKKGLIQDGEELGQCLGIFEKYHSFQTTYQSVIIPTVVTLSEEVGKAAQVINKKIAEQDALTAAQDPNVITEVEVKYKDLVIPDNTSAVLSSVSIKEEAYNEIPLINKEPLNG